MWIRCKNLDLEPKTDTIIDDMLDIEKMWVYFLIIPLTADNYFLIFSYSFVLLMLDIIQKSYNIYYFVFGFLIFKDLFLLLHILVACSLGGWVEFHFMTMLHCVSTILLLRNIWLQRELLGTLFTSSHVNVCLHLFGIYLGIVGSQDRQ